MNECAYLAVLIIIAANSFSDVRRHEICPIFTAAGGCAGLFYACIRSSESPWLYPASLLPGTVLLLFSFLTRGAVGAGDGLLLIALAGYLELTDILVIVFSGMLFSSVYGSLRLLMGDKRDREFAFVPFLFAGYVMHLLLIV